MSNSSYVMTNIGVCMRFNAETFYRHLCTLYIGYLLHSYFPQAVWLTLLVHEGFAYTFQLCGRVG